MNWFHMFFQVFLSLKIYTSVFAIKRYSSIMIWFSMFFQVFLSLKIYTTVFAIKKYTFFYERIPYVFSSRSPSQNLDHRLHNQKLRFSSFMNGFHIFFQVFLFILQCEISGKQWRFSGVLVLTQCLWTLEIFHEWMKWKIRGKPI